LKKGHISSTTETPATTVNDNGNEILNEYSSTRKGKGRTIETIHKELDEGDRVTITTKPKKILEQEI
jgi:hypothetical protein